MPAPLFVICLILAMGVFWLCAMAATWPSNLSSKKPFRNEPDFTIRFVAMEYGCCVRGGIRLGVNSEGVVCGLMFPENLIFQPLCLPWSYLVETRKGWRWFRTVLVLDFLIQSCMISIRLPMRHAEAVLAAIRGSAVREHQALPQVSSS